MSTVGAVSTARSTILVTISSNLPLPDRLAVALRDRFSYHLIEYGSVGMFDIPQHRIYHRDELTMVGMPVLIMAGGGKTDSLQRS
jgi:hypothetical protein